MTLTPSDFGAYFEALWESSPYPWQQRLLEEVFALGRWPEQLDLPTGSGKTSALDIALFLLALEAERPPREQRFPRRIFLVVDRRTIVDQGHERARKLARKIDAAKDGVLGLVRAALCRLHGGDRPVETAILRGAMVRDDAWARRPDQPLLALSTVDQVGSRLLFRGYGVSDGMKPVHAGLLGSDCLYLLDEVHLSVAFDETLSALKQRYLREGSRVQVCRLSATPHAATDRSFGLSEEDRDHPRLRVRLEARKPATLLPVDVKGEEPERVLAFAAALAHAARGLARPGATVGVVVNRVETARQVARLLEGDVALITGRMRPLDRQRVEQEIKEWIDPDRPPAGNEVPRTVVATQCIEAGADYDFDALVTECAPMDALRQRVGRLNRSGKREHARAVVAIRKDQAKDDDPIYGAAMAETWAWLTAQESLDFGISSFSPPADPLLRASVARAPLLLPSHLDAFVQTSPIPEPDPDVALFLHGPRPEQAEVQVIWRADLGPLLAAEDVEAIVDRLEAVPPGSLEALPLPIGALRRWLTVKDRRPISLSDAGPEPEPEEEDWRHARDGVPQVFCWRTESSFIPADGLRPGDTIILAAEQGGLFKGTFDPFDHRAVSDLGDEVQLKLRGRPTLRLHPSVLRDQGAWGAEAPRPGLDEEEDVDAGIDDWLDRAPEPWRLPLMKLRGRKRRLITHEDQGGRFFTLVARAKEAAGDDASTDAETSSHTGVRVTLERHLCGVGHWAALFATRIGFPDRLVADLESAGRWHDLGKLDPRFQRWLHDGNRYAAELSPPLAKSATPAQDRVARRRAREKSEYPMGARHELMSLALLEAAPSVREEVQARSGDWDLVCYLVSSHHGHGRPFAPVVLDDAPVDVAWNGVACRSDHGLERLDSGVSERFWRLVRKYDPHGLAWLEAVLRLADHHESALEQQSTQESS